MINSNCPATTCILFILAVLFIVSCLSHRKLNDDQTYNYRCENGEEFTAIVHQDRDQTIIRMGDQQYILDITPSGSGEKYSDGINNFWIKGDEAFLELSGKDTYKSCKVVE